MSQTSSARWTNASVVEFAKGKDPIAAIERRARDVALQAIDKGWSGPPFDPIRLADILGIAVSARADVPEARTVPSGRKGFTIEFNPTRSRGRVRFSIAHEIAHTFFADCAERVRHRGHDAPQRSDAWQLELLCNIAAAELIMPIGTLTASPVESPSIENVLLLRQKYDVSTEAILIRLAKVSNSPITVFSASTVEAGSHRNGYRLDYVFPSHSWKHDIPAGMIVPASSVVRECTAIGYTAKGREKWGGFDTDFAVECVGLPPYPGSNVPRVAGLLKRVNCAPAVRTEVLYIAGDALAPRGDGCRVIAHIVNDRTANWGGGGFASAVRQRYAAVQSDFQEWVSEDRTRLSLGCSRLSVLSNNLYVFSMVAQHGFGPSTSPRIRYAALEMCFADLAAKAKELGATIHMPKIGVGHAGGNWQIIEELILDKLVRVGVPVTVYSLPERVSTGAWTDGRDN